MVCEACVTNKPVYILPLLGHKETKPKKFIDQLIQEGIVRPFHESIESWTYTPFNDTEKIAARIREKMNL
jgi:mitochondrial fission protein ELM1